MLKRILLPVLLLSFIYVFENRTMAQPTWTIDLLGKEKKPEKFENRKLGSEKFADKKFTIVRHFFQNNYTHYNYYFNANNKINSVVERAKASQKDDYTRLLTYYPFSLENTASQKSELDSVILKATAGILLHDLRNDWVDNMYLLMGKAFYFRKDFDSAGATFQFINYNLFPRKKHEDDNRVVGTGDAAANSSLSIANKEKPNILQKVTAQPPSRNDALIWMVRTLIEQNEMGEAAGLINTLQYDPNLPTRLKNDLDEVNAYWFYKQNLYDSAAAYLEKALSNAESKQDLSRSEFLLAQLYETTHQFDKATSFYEKVARHTVDPLMDIYARLNNAKMLKGTNPEELDKSMATLAGMARKDKFEAFRDIVFYAAGELAMQKPDTNAAVIFFNKSLKYNEQNTSYKNKTFLQLADIAYNRKQYKMAFAFYDSLQSGDTTLNNRLEEIHARRNSLSKIVAKIYIIEREDSLQALAAMTPAERSEYLKKMVKRLRKERGLKEEDTNNNGGTAISFDNPKNAPVDLFANNGSKGDWYFYNAASKAKGFSDFKRKWGNRKNIDNWQRSGATEAATSTLTSPLAAVNAEPDDIDKPVVAVPKNNNGKDVSRGANPENATTSEPEDISIEGLMANIPLTPEKLAASHAKLSLSMYELGKIFQNDLEDYEQAIVTYEQSLQRYPDSLYQGNIYLDLYYCYNKTGNRAKADYYKNLLSTKFAGSHAALLVTKPEAANPSAKNATGTKRYEDIYNLFIEGNFDRAFKEKKVADSIYGTNFWSPQLLYIEAVYHIKQRNDSTAIAVLSNISSLYPKATLTPRAERMIDVLKRRSQIEDYLNKLQITRAKDDEIVKIDDGSDDRPRLKRNDSALIVSPKNYLDTSKTKTVVLPAVPVVPVDSLKVILKDTVKTASAAVPTVKETPVKTAPVFVQGPFTLNTGAPQNVVMLLNKVDVTYVNESKNAFTRYLNEMFKGEAITLTKDAIDADRSLLIFSSFASADAALQFMVKVKKAAPEEISWLPVNKYSFLLVDEKNLQLLKTNKDVTGYLLLLNKAFPGKF